MAMDRLLPGVPAHVERIYADAPGNEIASGKFDNPESSAALVANAFGFFLEQANALPPLPGLEIAGWLAKQLALEAKLHMPWGRSPAVLDVLVVTHVHLIGIESKRFEPFRSKSSAEFSDCYSKPLWGGDMKGYEDVRDKLRQTPGLFRFIDAVQLVKHAFALRTAAVRRPGGAYHNLSPILFYVYAEPDFWPKTGAPVLDAKKAAHKAEIADFKTAVAGDEVAFAACSYQQLLAGWSSCPDPGISAHAEAVRSRFSP